MKLKTLTAMMAVTLFAGLPVLAADSPAAHLPQGTEAWAQTMWDFTKNPQILKDPKTFVPFTTAATEPGFYTALGTQMLDPGVWANMTLSMLNPAAYGAWMPLMTDPNVYTKWLAASLDPNFYTALLTQFSDPGKMLRWMMLPADPKLWNMMLQSMNPAVYLKWMMAPFDPRWLQAGISTINPNVYLGWLGAMLNPGSYGDVWKGFLTAPYVPLQATPAPVPSPASVGGTPYLFNPFDPNTWTQPWPQTTPQPATTNPTK